MRTEWQWFRSIAGLLIAPAVPALVLALVFPGDDGVSLFAVIFATSAYAAALLIGLPVHLVLEGQLVRAVAAYVLTGCLVGVGAALLAYGVWALLVLEHAAKILSDSLRVALAASLYGAVTGTVFWFIAIWRRGSP